MKQAFIIILCLNVFGNTHSQGITLLYKGGGSVSWNDPVNWIQSNTPDGQTPIQRAPTELDDVVFSSSRSGLSSVQISFEDPSDFIEIGGSGSTGYRCRSMHVSHTNLSLTISNLVFTLTLNVSTTNGGFVLIDSGSNFNYGHFQLYGGDPAKTDLEIVDSNFGSLFSHEDWSSIRINPTGKARFVGSTLGGRGLGFGGAGGELYAENCKFFTTYFTLDHNSTATILNSSIENDGNNVSMAFHIGRNANFVSSNFNIKSYMNLEFFTSGSVLNGNVSVIYGAGNAFSFRQEDPANPLPNIINGDLSVGKSETMGIMGDVKISGDLINNAIDYEIYPDSAHVIINGQDILKIGGITNYANNVSITDCVREYCHFKLEFFGNNNSTIYWPVGFPVDTLVVNKSGCAKVTVANPLYVSGQAIIKNGQLVLNPNESIKYKFVCAGDLNISDGGGVFLGKNAVGAVAKIAVGGDIYDYNTVIDSSCTGLSNPYNGDVTIYRSAQSVGNNLLRIVTNANIGNINLVVQNGADFMLESDLTVNNFSFINPGKLFLGNHNVVVNGNVLNYGPANCFVTNGLGKLQINNIENIETVFPVGASSTSYNPAILKNSGTADNFSVNVQPLVLSGGIAGNAYTAGVVNRTWNIGESIPGASNVSLTLQWNAEDELAGFERNTSWLAHHTSGAWNTGAQMSSGGSGPYTLTRNNITGFSPFAVMGSTIVLPVVLLDFYGKYKDKAVVLNWSTGSELNVKYLAVEKSFDQSLFKPLINFPSSGNLQGKNNYHHLDYTDLKEINYYRLKIVDLNGTYKYSKTIAVSAPPGSLVFVFPNPVKDELFIRLPDISIETKISIIDIKGTCVKNLNLKAGIADTSIDTMDLPAGVYSIIFDSGKTKKTLQFIKQ